LIPNLAENTNTESILPTNINKEKNVKDRTKKEYNIRRFVGSISSKFESYRVVKK